MRTRRRGALVLALLTCTAVGCASDADRMPEVTGGFGKEPNVRIEGGPPEEVTSATVIKGDGAEIGRNDLVVTQMATFPWTEGKGSAKPEFSSYRIDSDVLLSAAEFAAIAPGASKALIGKPGGSRVSVFVPPGAENADTPQDGGPPSGGLHVIDIVDHYSAAQTVTGDMSAPDDPSLPSVTVSPSGKPKISVPDTAPPAKLRSVDLIEGDGAKIASGDRVVVQFTGMRWDSGAEFDSTWEYGGRPTAFSLGTGQVIPAWEKALIGRTAGSRVLVVAPPGTAYGEEGNSSAGIPPDTTLVYVIDVLGAH